MTKDLVSVLVDDVSREPHKKRAMTREEKVEAVVKELVSHPNRQWSTDIIDAVCRELGLPAEVEE